MKRFLKFRYGEKGFTLLELLIVVAILGILAAVLVPNLAGFIGTGKLAAYNTEVANVETAALAYMADNNGTMPELTTASDLLAGQYINKAAGHDYGFDEWGKVDILDTTPYSATETIIWDRANHKWIKGEPVVV